MLQMFYRTFFSFIVCLLANSAIFSVAYGQQIYTYEDLAQEGVTITSRPQVKEFKEGKTKEGTSITYNIYEAEGLEELKTFTVHIDGAHPILNPEPTGVIINGKQFDFYCSAERSVVKYLSAFLDMYVFDYLGRKFLCFFAFREDCLTAGCRFKCYNVFDITDPENITPYSFASIFSGSQSFGDFSNDGKIDFLSAVPRAPESFLDSEKDDKSLNVLLNVQSFEDGKVTMQKKAKLGNPYYLYVKPLDDEVTRFTLLQYDWFVPLKNSAGNQLDMQDFYPHYEEFDPKNNFIYDMNGHRVDTRNWVIHMTDYPELDGALDYCEELKEKGFPEAFIKVDQYGGRLNFQVLYGNYWSKPKIEIKHEEMKEKGIIDNVFNDDSFIGEIKHTQNDLH